MRTRLADGPAPPDTALGGDLLPAVETPALVFVVVGQFLGDQLQAVIASGHGLWLVGAARPHGILAAEGCLPGPGALCWRPFP